FNGKTLGFPLFTTDKKIPPTSAECGFDMGNWAKPRDEAWSPIRLGNGQACTIKSTGERLGIGY
ncbi:hypothetical protein QUA43_19295, partial [Microcoleus sp. N9_B4]|uniref:hypothetical protein n=1 Tax=Microcoleus sp. N9_B4 TaxID=3055386 RepID=UPI002FD66956